MKTCRRCAKRRKRKQFFLSLSPSSSLPLFLFESPEKWTVIFSQIFYTVQRGTKQNRNTLRRRHGRHARRARPDRRPRSPRRPRRGSAAADRRRGPPPHRRRRSHRSRPSASSPPSSSSSLLSLAFLGSAPGALILPGPPAERAPLLRRGGPQPAADALEVERVAARAPDHGGVVARELGVGRAAVKGGPADAADVVTGVPGPGGDGAPVLDGDAEGAGRGGGGRTGSGVGDVFCCFFCPFSESGVSH